LSQFKVDDFAKSPTFRLRRIALHLVVTAVPVSVYLFVAVDVHAFPKHLVLIPEIFFSSDNCAIGSKKNPAAVP
jgi:hypothetical protein